MPNFCEVNNIAICIEFEFLVSEPLENENAPIDNIKLKWKASDYLCSHLSCNLGLKHKEYQIEPINWNVGKRLLIEYRIF